MRRNPFVCGQFPQTLFVLIFIRPRPPLARRTRVGLFILPLFMMTSRKKGSVFKNLPFDFRVFNKVDRLVGTLLGYTNAMGGKLCNLQRLTRNHPHLILKVIVRPKANVISGRTLLNYNLQPNGALKFRKQSY